MGVGQAIKAKLVSDAAVNGIIAGRVFPAVSPQDGKAYPQVVYAVDSAIGKPDYVNDDALTGETIRLACIATEYDDADALATAVINAIDDEAGTWGSIQVQGCFLEDQTESIEADDDAGQSSILYVIEQQYSIWYIWPD